MKRSLFLSCTFVALVASTRIAAASPLFDAVGPIGGDGGAHGVVHGGSAASTYFNPALLLEADEDLTVGFALVSQQLGIDLDARRGGDVPDFVGNRDLVSPNGTPIPNDSVPSNWLRSGCPAGSAQGFCPPPGFAARPRQAAGDGQKNRTYVALGLVKHVVPDRFAIGIYTMLPVSSFATAQGFYVDQREALFSNSLHSELYGDRLTAISITFGAAFQILPELTLGAGVSIALTNAATSASYVRDSTNYDTLLLDDGVKTQVDLSPVVGVRWKPVEWLRIGAAIHAPEQFSIDTQVTAALPSGTESGTQRRDLFDWMPWRVSFGVEADVARRAKSVTTIVGSVRYGFWSSYRDRHDESPSMYGKDLAWDDTLTVAAGVHQRLGPFRVYLDLQYVPSPVPEQVGASNYVDNDRLGAIFGGTADVVIGPTRLRPGVKVFVDRFIPRHNTKDDSRIVDELPDDTVSGSTHDPVAGAKGLQTNNPGWPGYSSKGWFWGAAVSIEVPL